MNRVFAALSLLLLLLAACDKKASAPQSGEPSKHNTTEATSGQKEKPQDEHADEHSGKHAGEAGHKDESDHEPLPSRVRLPASVVAAAKVHTTKVVLKALPMTIEVPGEVGADPDRSARITARVPGRISELFFKEGDSVKAGALLAVIESAELARTAATYSAAQSRVQAAQKNAARVESLSGSGLAANQEVLDAKAHAGSISAEAQAARRSLLALGIAESQLGQVGARFELRAPFAGFTLSRNAIVGQTVPAEHVLCDLIDFSRAYFIGRLYEKNLAQVRAGQLAEVRLNAYPEVVFLGKVETVSKMLDPSARTVVTRIAIPNQDDLLKAGLFGKARVSLGGGSTHPRVLVVPLSAVTRIADRDVVFVRQPDDDFEVHPVTLGPSASGEVQILSGLREGESVVSDGVFTLKGAILKSTFAEEE